jgi:hypothetical protein
MNMSEQPKLQGRSMRLLLALLGFLVCLGQGSLKAQSCQENIVLAEEKYNAGLFNEVMELGLDSCVKENDEIFPVEQKIRAYKVLLLIALYRDQAGKAMEMMQAILDLDPEYTPIDTLEPIEFRGLYDQFDTDPVGFIEPRVGFNITRPVRLRAYGVQEQSQQEVDTVLDYLPRIDFSLGAMFEKPLTRDLSIGVGLMYSRRTYGYSELLPVVSDDKNDNLELTFNERQQWLELPISFRGNLRIMPGGLKNTLIPYVFGGSIGQLMLQSKMINVQRNLINIQGNKDLASRLLQVTTDKIPLFGDTPLRHRTNLSLTGGVGLQFKVGYNYAVLEYQAGYMLRSLSRADNRYSNQELVYTYGYLDDDFTQLTHTISLGFKHIFYNPKPR